TSLEFYAGKVEYDESTHRATPIPGKGKITIKSAGDGMVSLLWTARGKSSTATTIDDSEELLLFPGDAYWRHVKQCGTGRVIMLKFKSSGDRMMFWLQKPNEDNEDNVENKLDVAQLSKDDEEILVKLNEMLKEEE
ncbi:hypothetical protein NADFUDRAFT_11889, partial [Nadsonia fulvescens var. elongata DSM 6958]